MFYMKYQEYVDYNELFKICKPRLIKWFYATMNGKKNFQIHWKMCEII